MSQTTHWADIQEKTFTRWVNDYLRQRGMKIDNLCDGLSDGLALCHLLEILSNKKVGKFNKHPRIQIQKIENITFAIDFIKSQNIQLVNCGSADIAVGNKRIVLGLVWTLIYFYEICQGDPNYQGAKDDLLQWVQKQIPEYHEEHPIKSFKGKQWCNGKALCALVDSIIPKNSNGNRPDFDVELDWRKLDGKKKQENCTTGIDTAHKYLNIDKLLVGDEMCQKKCDERAIMCYIAQFRNIKEGDLKPAEEDKIPEIHPATLCKAYGPGLVEAIVGEETEFYVEAAMVDGENHKLDVNITGPSPVKWEQDDNKDGTYTVKYKPTEEGEYVVTVMVDGEHIPGSEFHVLVLEDESLGGEGKIRVFFSTTSSSQKSKKDRFSLERLLTAKKVHLRVDFDPWVPVDLMTEKDRNAVFKKAGTRALPIVFVDDVYVGDYDKLQEYEEEGKLDDLINADGAEYLTEEEHAERLKNIEAMQAELN